MTDKELLEYAAKAAGIEIEADGLFWDISQDPAVLREWNPLTDDGDALRLAVKLNMEIKNDGVWIKVGYSHGSPDYFCSKYDSSYSVDELLATRRAIVRAAVEIGKGVK